MIMGGNEPQCHSVKSSLILLKGGMTKIGIIMGEGRAVISANEKNMSKY
jgi:hypothetical protein